MTVKKIGLVKNMEFEPVKGIVADGKEILLVNMGTNFTAIGNKCTHMGCNYPAARLTVKRSGAPAMDRCSMSEPVR